MGTFSLTRSLLASPLGVVRPKDLSVRKVAFDLRDSYAEHFVNHLSDVDGVSHLQRL